MSDYGVSAAEFGLIVFVFAAPWLLGGAVVGAVIWHLTWRRRWWLGALAGAALGAATGFFGMMP